MRRISYISLQKSISRSATSLLSVRLPFLAGASVVHGFQKYRQNIDEEEESVVQYLRASRKNQGMMYEYVCMYILTKNRSLRGQSVNRQDFYGGKLKHEEKESSAV